MTCQCRQRGKAEFHQFANDRVAWLASRPGRFIRWERPSNRDWLGGPRAGLYDKNYLAPTGTRSPDPTTVSTDQKLILNSSDVIKGRFPSRAHKICTQ